MSRFAFGQNWKDFVSTALNEERQRISKAHLMAFLRLPDLSGKSFLDIGCGSGIHSLAALQAGAKVFSFDYDQDSVDAARMVWKSVGKPAGGSLVIQNAAIVNASHLNISSDPADPIPTVALRSAGQSIVTETILASPTSSIDIDRGTLHTAMLTSAAPLRRQNATKNGRVARIARGFHGCHRKRIDLDAVELVSVLPPDELLVIDEAIAKLAAEDPQAARLVRLRYYAGLSVEEAAELSGLSRSSAYEHWSYARAWLHCDLYGR